MNHLEKITKYTKSFLNQDEGSNLYKLWKLYCTQLNEIEEVLVQMFNDTDLATIGGKVLDDLGASLNIPRIPGQSDDTYRIYLPSMIIAEYSGGQVNELIQVGKIILGNTPESGIRIVEMYIFPGNLFLDASLLLDGESNLDPGSTSYAAISVFLEAPVENMNVPDSVLAMIALIKAAGITMLSHITYILLSYSTDCLLYTVPCTKWTGAGKLDGKTKYNTFITFNIEDIAVGDGATGPPQPEDIGLTNELIRKVARIVELPSGEKRYELNVLPDELEGEDVNEMAVFTPDHRLVAKKTFPAKVKPEGVTYDYVFQTNENEV